MNLYGGWGRADDLSIPLPSFRPATPAPEAVNFSGFYGGYAAPADVRFTLPAPPRSPWDSIFGPITDPNITEVPASFRVKFEPAVALTLTTLAALFPVGDFLETWETVSTFTRAVVGKAAAAVVSLARGIARRVRRAFRHLIPDRPRLRDVLPLAGQIEDTTSRRGPPRPSCVHFATRGRATFA